MSEIGLFWLLLPLAAYTGWLLRGRSQIRSNERNAFTTNYFRGLNYLLNEEPDKAIEIFLKIAEVDSNTVETHLALGSLFRRRGEVDRAIRFHQNLISRPGLSDDEKKHALLELGEDYMRAGLLDRAEKLFVELVEEQSYTPSAMEHLLAIYQQERDWHHCIEYSKRLQEASGRDMRPITAQFYCEMAAEALATGNADVALSNLKRALRTHDRCVRASLMEGRIALLEDDFDRAIKSLKRAVDQDEDYLPEVLEPLLTAYAKADREDDAVAYLRQTLTRYRGISPVLALAEFIQRREGKQAAVEFIGEQLKIRPSVRGLDYLIGLNLQDSDGQARENLLILQELTSRLLANKPVYRCSQCGFGARSHHWQCPSCKQWNTVKPIHGVAGE